MLEEVLMYGIWLPRPFLNQAKAELTGGLASQQEILVLKLVDRVTHKGLVGPTVNERVLNGIKVDGVYCLSEAAEAPRSEFSKLILFPLLFSAIICNGTLFIDGGEVRYLEDNRTISVYTAQDLETVDLSQSWTNSDQGLFKFIAKPYNASDAGAYPPSLNAGASYTDASNLFFYGGSIGNLNHSATVPPVATWKYNIQRNEWTDQGFGGVPLQRLAEGVIAQSSTGKAYYLGGIVTPGGNPTIDGTPGADNYIVSGLLSLDMKTLTWSNISSTGLNTYGTIGEGYMNIIESVGQAGILVAFGGYTRPIGSRLSVLASLQMDMNDQATVFDIASNNWYRQKSTGEIPPWRMAGCSIVVPAPDQSSFSIYVFGGMGTTVGNSDGDVYVLSLPSFQWIRVHEGNNVRIKHKCQLLGKHTMLVVGGTVPTDHAEYDPEPVNCDSGAFANGLGIFDLRTHTWLMNYNAQDSGDYTIHSAISDVIGGNSSGSANVREPQGGFANDTLASLFRKVATPTPSSASSATAPAPGPASQKGHLSKGGIAGIAVGCAFALGIGALLFFIANKRRKAKQRQNEPHPGAYPRSPSFPRYSHIRPLSGPFELDHTAERPIYEKPASPTHRPAQEPSGLPGDH
ncbi:hypothetical protein CDV55_101944 [Aspergillus turcosus]|uniref:Attractin/MKLN-like beta-propeller domain-containing protein n=1 Tax=Aspergillus turcosus TaxID=1245748 RepID=A0A229WW20_9EURO|nr:hypothetical protein CDV55_101944 [Aspergillus turcosus]RLL93607.1 hypothetical protein CFD26_101077 [Aspergillus turcosus]